MVDYRVDKGDTLEVDYDVTNTGDVIGTQTIKLLQESTQEDSDADVTVDVGITKTGTLTWDTSGATAQQYTVKVESDDDSDTFTLEVVDPTGTAYYLIDIDDTNEPISAGEDLDVTVTAENVGDQSGTQDLILKIDGTQEDSISGVGLGADATTTKTLTWSTGTGDNGDFTARVETNDDFDGQTVSVGQQSGFTVAIDSTNSPVDEGEDLDVTATITNTTAQSDQQDVTLDVGGTQRDLETVNLAGNDSTTITLTWSTQDGDGGSYTATVASDDDSDDTSVEIGVAEKTIPSGATTIDDFDSGSVDPAWETNSVGSWSASTNQAISEDYSGYFENSDDFASVVWDFNDELSITNPGTASAWVYIDKFNVQSAATDADQFGLRVFDDGNADRFAVRLDTNIEEYELGVTLNKNEWYYFELYNMDWNANSYSKRIVDSNGTELASGSFSSPSDPAAGKEIAIGMGSEVVVDAYIDNVYLDDI